MNDLQFMFCAKPVDPNFPFMFILFTDSKVTHPIKIGLN